MLLIDEIWAHNKSHPHFLCNFDDYTKKYYFIILLTAALVDEKQYDSKLQSIIKFSDIVEYTPEYSDMMMEVKQSKTISAKTLDDCAHLFRNNEIGWILVLDCMILLMNYETDRDTMLQFISNIASLFEIDSNKILFLSNLAAVIVTGDLSKYKCDIVNDSDLYEFYLDKFSFNDYRSIFYADRVVEMWYDNQPNIENWWRTNARATNFTQNCFVCALSFETGMMLYNTGEIIIDSTPKSITCYGHFNIGHLSDYIGSKAAIHEYKSNITFDELENHKQLIIYTKHFIMNDVAAAKGVDGKDANDKNKMMEVFSKYPIGVFTHCLDLKSKAESFFTDSKGEPNEINEWQLWRI